MLLNKYSKIKNNCNICQKVTISTEKNKNNDSIFANTTDEFKRGQVASLSNYLMNMDRNDPNNEYGRNTIINKINEFNNLKNGYQIGNTELLSLNPKELNLFVTKGSDKYEPTVYTPLKN